MMPILELAGKRDRKLVAVFGFSSASCRCVVRYLSRQQPEIPIWLFSTAPPDSETAALCERIEVCRHAPALLVRAQLALWPHRVALCAASWTGKPGNWLAKLAPFLVQPFRVLLANENGDFLPGRPRSVLLHLSRRLRDRASRLRFRVRAVSLLALATALQFLRSPHRALFHRLHSAAALAVPPLAENSEGGVVTFQRTGTDWDGPALRRLVESSGARWILWSHDPAGDISDLTSLSDDAGVFAVARQAHFRGWKSMLLATAPFRRLQPGEATRVLAPLSGTILVSRQKLATLGVPDCGLALTAWLELFWKAAAAGWRSYAVGSGAPVTAEPDFPVEETAFALRVLRSKARRMLGPSDPELARGNIAFRPSAAVFPRHSAELRVLVISPFVPYPLTHGGAVRIFNLCRALANRVDFALVAVREAEDEIDYRALHQVFRDVWAVDLDEPESRDPDLPRQVRRYRSRSLSALVGNLCREWRPDLLQIEYTQLAGLHDSSGGVPAILVEHDLTLDLYRQLARHKPGELASREYRRWLGFEQRWLREYEGVWTVCEEERRAAIRHGNRRADRTFTVPNGVDTLRFQPSEAVEWPPEILFVGSFRHLPNVLGFERLLYEIMPLVWARFPQAVLRVVAGPNHERFLRLLRPAAAPLPDGTDGRVRIHGFVDDLRPLYARAAVAVAPLAVSSGTNIKVLEAMACGKAIVSTAAGCAGLGLRDGVDALIRDGAHDFAAAVCRLLADQTVRGRMGAHARRQAEERFAWEAIAARALESYMAILNRREGREARQREHQCIP